MDKTRASLRRARIYAAVLVACGIYAALPVSHRETFRAEFREAAGRAIDWIVDHGGRR